MAWYCHGPCFCSLRASTAQHNRMSPHTYMLILFVLSLVHIHGYRAYCVDHDSSPLCDPVSKHVLTLCGMWQRHVLERCVCARWYLDTRNIQMPFARADTSAGADADAGAGTPSSHRSEPVFSGRVPKEIPYYRSKPLTIEGNPLLYEEIPYYWCERVLQPWRRPW